MNAVSFLKINASKFPDKTGFVFEDIAYTYDQAQKAAEGFAVYLKTSGIERGDKVCTMFYNSIEQAYAYFAVLMVGAVIVPINFRFIEREITYIATDSDAKAILHGPEFMEIVEGVKQNCPEIRFSLSVDVNSKKTRALLETPDNSKSDALAVMSPDMSDESFINYTSGTTGKPKGVIITHSNNVWNQIKLVIDTPLNPADVVIGSLPIFHSGGMGRFLATMTVGGVFVSWKNFNAEQTIAAVSKYKGTFLLLVPAMAEMIFALPDLEKYNVDSLTKCLLTAAPVSVDMKKRALKLFYNADIIDGYGLTENTSATTMLKGDDVISKPSSVGLTDIFTEIRIFDERHKLLPTGEIGEIAVCGPTVMKGYYKNPIATDETIKDGWLLTGDLGRMDEDGYLYVVGRKKEMIISGGENIYPAEVEAVLNRHPKILESAVIGIPDSKWGETGMALIVLNPGQEMTTAEVEKYCIETMARYKRPKIIRFVDSLIKNIAGKIKKHELKKIYVN
ncbi:class I adenylate-forming enzyme family protein [Thermodesulfobacteriota bacterium]